MAMGARMREFLDEGASEQEIAEAKGRLRAKLSLILLERGVVNPTIALDARDNYDGVAGGKIEVLARFYPAAEGI